MTQDTGTQQSPPEPTAPAAPKGNASQGGSSDSPTRDALLKNAQKVENLFLVMMEHGLFSYPSGGGDRPSTILRGIADARRLARAGDLDSASTKLVRAELAIYEVVHAKKGGPGRWWRWWRIHQLPLLAYYALILALLLNVASGWFEWTADAFWGVPAAAFGFGALGAVLRGLYHLHKQVAARRFRSGFTQAHLAAPWIGGLFGLFTYLLLQAGLLALDGTQDNGELATSPLALTLALLAGFKWEWITAQIDRIGKTDDDEPPPDGASTARPDDTPKPKSGAGSASDEAEEQPSDDEPAEDEEQEVRQEIAAEVEPANPETHDERPTTDPGDRR